VDELFKVKHTLFQSITLLFSPEHQQLPFCHAPRNTQGKKGAEVISKSVPSFKHTSSCTITKNKPPEQRSAPCSWHRRAAARAPGARSTWVQCNSSPLHPVKRNARLMCPALSRHETQNSCLKERAEPETLAGAEAEAYLFRKHPGRQKGFSVYLDCSGRYFLLYGLFLSVANSCNAAIIAHGVSSLYPHVCPHSRASREGLGLLTSSRTVYMSKQAALFFSQLFVDSDYVPF